MLSRDDIIEKIKEGSLEIYPLDKRNLTGIGYNLSTTYFAFSISRGELLPVKEEVTVQGKEHYVDVPPEDTALFFSKEYITVDNTLAGTFHSKVSRVCQGLGHVSTTLDPTWQGQLIVSVNNPTKGPIRFDLDKNGNLVTLLLHELETPVTGPDIHDNNRGRCDLLASQFVGPPRGGDGAREKYLELREFVMGAYADSLNGHDDFLRDGVGPDRYSRKEAQLKALLERLSGDEAFLVNGEYLLKDGGSLTPLLGEEEKALLRSCTHVEICGGCGDYGVEDLGKPIPVVDCESADAVLDRVRSCIRAVDYELKTIDHNRRIDWQNARVLGFASEGSDLAKAQEASRRKRAVRKKIPKTAAFTLMLVLSISALVLGFAGPQWMGDSRDAVVSGGIAGLVNTFALLASLLSSDFGKGGDENGL